MSHRALGPMFHGTAHEVAPGSDIIPGKQFGKSNFKHKGVGPRGKAHSESAFATQSEAAAWHFAEASTANFGGRGRVHIVEPHPEMEPGLYNHEHRTFARRSRENYTLKGHADKWQEWAAPSFKPTGKTIDIKPGHQGTFPNLNWNQFDPDQTRRRRFLFDRNHPKPDEVLHGGPSWSQQGIKSDWEQHNRENGYPDGNRDLDGPLPEPENPRQGRLFG